MNIDQQLASLHSALDDVLDLERGLADATLPRAHTELVTGLDDALDLDAGLTRVMSSLDTPVPLIGFAAFADELAARPAAERLAARSRLPVALLIEARGLANSLPNIRALRDALDYSLNFGADRTGLLIRALRIAEGLGCSTDSLGIALRLVSAIQRESPRTRIYAELLYSSCRKRLITVLLEFHAETPGTAPASLVVGLAYYTATLVKVINRVLSVLTNMVGADLSSADLSGIPLDGVRWSSDTRWPVDWEAWVRDNSVRVSADVFEIRPGKAGSWLPT